MYLSCINSKISFLQVQNEQKQMARKLMNILRYVNKHFLYDINKILMVQFLHIVIQIIHIAGEQRYFYFIVKMDCTV